jgi:hypothetical protein
MNFVTEIYDAKGKVATSSPEKPHHATLEQIRYNLNHYGVLNTNFIHAVLKIFIGRIQKTNMKRFCFRTIRFDKDKGFFLNGNLKFKGVCSRFRTNSTAVN